MQVWMLAPSYLRTGTGFEGDPVKAAEEEIRRYFTTHVLAPPARARSGNGGMIVCFLAIYAALACIAAITLFCVNRMECDPMFTDRGLTAACRVWSGNMGVAPDSGARWSSPDANSF
jgi:hypothetical protein